MVTETNKMGFGFKNFKKIIISIVISTCNEYTDDEVIIENDVPLVWTTTLEQFYETNEQ